MPRTRKITVWVLNSCCPGEPEPVLPAVFGTEAEAEAYADKMLRDEWVCHEPEDDDGKPLPYPGSWEEAVQQLAEYLGREWGLWELTSHQIEVPE